MIKFVAGMLFAFALYCLGWAAVQRGAVTAARAAIGAAEQAEATARQMVREK